MALLGMSAHAYVIPAVVLLLAAVWLWSGRAPRGLAALLAVNLLTGLLLILVLWLGDRLNLPKLDIAGVMFLGNVATGGPLMSLLGGLMLVRMRRSTARRPASQPLQGQSR